MNYIFEAIFSIGVLLFSLGYIFVKRDKLPDWLIKRTNPVNASEDLASKALDKIESWTKWMAGIQTTAIAFMGYLLKESECEITEWSGDYGFLSILFFGSSILLCSWLLGGVPSMQIRLKPEVTGDNDIFEMRVFENRRIRAGTLFGLLHFYFVLGILFLALFTFSFL